jgi:hypothetical protein
MDEEIALIRRLMAENKIDKAFEMLIKSTSADQDLNNQVLTLSAKWKDVRTKENIGIIDNRDAALIHNQINYALVKILSELEKSHANSDNSSTAVATQTPVPANQKKVFISYNHQDAETANKIKEKLRALHIHVSIDSESMQAGEDIRMFIEESVRTTGTTLSIVSRNSLLSSWVAMESVNTFYHEKTDAAKKFIVCYVDDDFFRRNFTDDALDSIEAEIKEIQTLITSRMAKNRSIRDLQNELARMTDLRNNIDEIVRRLRESLCIDIRPENFEKNFNKIRQAVQA